MRCVGTFRAPHATRARQPRGGAGHPRVAARAGRGEPRVDIDPQQPAHKLLRGGAHAVPHRTAQRQHAASDLSEEPPRLIRVRRPAGHFFGARVEAHVDVSALRGGARAVERQLAGAVQRSTDASDFTNVG